LGLRGKRVKRSGENYTKKSFVICITHRRNFVNETGPGGGGFGGGGGGGGGGGLGRGGGGGGGGGKIDGGC